MKKIIKLNFSCRSKEYVCKEVYKKFNYSLPSFLDKNNSNLNLSLYQLSSYTQLEMEKFKDKI